MKELKKIKKEVEELLEKIDFHPVAKNAIFNLIASVDIIAKERDELKEAEELAYMAKGLAQKGYRNLEKELRTLKDEINKLPDYMDDKYDLDNKGNNGYIDDCDSAILEIKKLINKIRLRYERTRKARNNRSQYFNMILEIIKFKGEI